MCDPVSLACQASQPLCEACLIPLHDEIKETLSAYIHVRRNRSSLTTALNDLRDTAQKVKAKVEEEEAHQRICNPDVRRWQKKVEEILRECDDDQEPQEPKRCACLCGCDMDLLHRHRVARKVVQNLQDVNKLKSDGDAFTPPFTHEPPQPMVEEQQIETPTIGMESALSQLLSRLDDAEKSIIGVYGIGGVGKTTLLKKLNNKLKENTRDYHVVIMIEVANSETLNVVDMQKIIAGRLGLPWNESESEKERSTFLRRALRKKRFVVLLDDVWKKFQLGDVGIPTPSSDNGCKLIVSSRLKQLCGEMGDKEPMEMPCLNENESLRLFRSNLMAEVSAAIDHDSDMRGSAMEIIRSCGGLPLALNVVGCALACSTDAEEWKQAATAMKRHSWRIHGVQEMLNVIKFSFDKLQEKQQKCFLYCTLFPEYGSINKELLVNYWVAEELVSGKSYDGYPTVTKLISACLLQRSDTEPGELKMHQITRQMGHREATDEGFMIKSGCALKQAPDVHRWTESPRISQMSNDIRELSIAPKCKGLLTLLLQNNPKLRHLGPKFFRSMSSLKVLDLSRTAIDKLPDCSAMVQLAYLNLSHTPIKEFPKQLCDALVQLLFLNMSNTNITELPKNLWKLKKLTHLYLSETPALKVIPHGTISRLFNVRFLDLCRSHYGISELPDLNLEMLKDLELLGITIYSQAVLGKLRRSDPLARSTQRLSLAHCQGMESLQLLEFKKMRHLKELYIDSCNQLQDLIVDHVEKEDTGIPSAKKRDDLKLLTLAFLPDLVRVSLGPAPHRFQHLRDLTIKSCPKLGNVSWVLRLESLERLVISQCDGLEEVVHEGSDTRTNGAPEVEEEGVEACEQRRDGFPKLRSMVLSDLHRLRSICQSKDLPCLQNIKVERCPNLRRLPVGRMPKLEQIIGENEWWEGMPPETKADLCNYFVTVNDDDRNSRNLQPQ
ncbi:hypothetical protein BHE74_00015530 [Ensete ventricosum]|nr:hypothetical protein BHE74_00015530 [Ensete ventricosum]